MSLGCFVKMLFFEFVQYAIDPFCFFILFGISTHRQFTLICFFRLKWAVLTCVLAVQSSVQEINLAKTGQNKDILILARKAKSYGDASCEVKTANYIDGRII